MEARRREWELRFPPLTTEWPLWLLEGNGLQLGVTADLAAALDIVENTFHVYDNIYAYSVRLGPDGALIHAKRRYEIWNRLNSRIRNKSSEAT